MKSKLIFLDQCESTQQHARNIFARTADVEQCVIATDEQTEGKGQGSNQWISEPGKNLLLSMIYPFRQRADRQSYLSRAVSLAICDLVMLYGSDYSIKWPNDILMNGKKISGILIEHQVSGQYITSSIIGIGLNANQEVFPRELNAVSLIHSTGTAFKLKELLKTLVRSIEARLFQYEKEQWEELDSAYHRLLAGYQQQCRFRLTDGSEITAVHSGVDAYGRIVLMSEGQKKAYDLNEARMIL